LLVFSFADEVDDTAAIKASARPLLEADISELLENTTRRLNSRSKGLLEVKKIFFKRKRDRVVFLHRTVNDFIAQPHITSQISSAVGDSFNPNRRLANGYLREIQYLAGRPADILPTVAWALEYALQSELCTGEVSVDCLDALRDTIDLCYGSKKVYWELLGNYRMPGADSFLKAVLGCSHFGYIRLKLDPGSQYFELLPKGVLNSLLEYALQGKILASPKALALSTAVMTPKLRVPKDICRLILDQGADPTTVIVSYGKFKGLDKELQDLLRPYVGSFFRHKGRLYHLFKSKDSGQAR
jgi:hypothetical protein